MDRLISLTVGTKEAEEWFRTFQEISELGANLGASHHYVSVSSTDLGSDKEPDEDDLEQTYHDDNTMRKVRVAVGRAVLVHTDANADLVTDIINEIQNAGILFRERVKR